MNGVIVHFTETTHHLPKIMRSTTLDRWMLCAINVEKITAGELWREEFEMENENANMERFVAKSLKTKKKKTNKIFIIVFNQDVE